MTKVAKFSSLYWNTHHAIIRKIDIAVASCGYAVIVALCFISLWCQDRKVCTELEYIDMDFRN